MSVGCSYRVGKLPTNGIGSDTPIVTPCEPLVVIDVCTSQRDSIASGVPGGDKRQGSDRPHVRESPVTLARDSTSITLTFPDGATRGRVVLCTRTGWRVRS